MSLPGLTGIFPNRSNGGTLLVTHSTSLASGKSFQSAKGISTMGNCKPFDLCTLMIRIALPVSEVMTEILSADFESFHHVKKERTEASCLEAYSRMSSRKRIT